jgi:hypothetical protein
MIACLLVSACTPPGARNPVQSATIVKAAGGVAPAGNDVVAAGGGNLIGQAGTNIQGNPYGMPTTVRLPMPASVVAAGGGNVVAPGGGNVVAPGGGNLIGQAGTNYRIAALPAADMLAAGVRENTLIYTKSTALIDQVLQILAMVHISPKNPVTMPDPGHPERILTATLEVKADHALISIGEGNTAKGATQMMSLRYTSPRKGRAVFHLTDPKGSKIFLATDFDLDAGQASADGAFDATQSDVNQQLGVGHWVFSRHAAAKADEAVFTMAGSVFLHNPGHTDDDGVSAFAAAFLPDDTGAFLFGAQTEATGDAFVFVPRVGVSTEHDFYMDAQGGDLPKEKASAALKGIMPADAAIYKPFPADPTTQDPFKDTRFAFED